MPFYEHEMSSATGTMVIISGKQVLLGRRKNDPYKDYWCLLGGFVIPDKETPKEAAIREVWEEAHIALDPSKVRKVTVQDAVDRDSRCRVYDFVYCTRVEDPEFTPGDDVVELRWFSIDNLPPLAFDHAVSLSKALFRMPDYLDDIAELLHRMVRVQDHMPEKELPMWRMYAALVLSKGKETTLKDVHDFWTAWAGSADPFNSHRVPFNQLSPEIQEKDRKYAEAIRQVALLREKGE